MLLLQPESGYWCLPFVCLIIFFSIAPMFVEEKNVLKVQFVFVTIIVLFVLFVLSFFCGALLTFEAFGHMFFNDYISLIVLAAGFYLVSIDIKSKAQGFPTPLNKTFCLIIGSILSGVLGTMGASLIACKWINDLDNNMTTRPRLYRAHTYMILIMVISNIAGGYSSLGDAPLFVGFLNGLDFFWPFYNLGSVCLVFCACLLLVHFIWDWVLWNFYETEAQNERSTQDFSLDIKFERGWVILFLMVMCTIVDGLYPEFYIRYWIVLMLFWLHNTRCAENIETDWQAVYEIAIIFMGLLTVSIPMIAMLQNSDSHNMFTKVFMIMKQPHSAQAFMYFWVSGVFSAFIDNVPTYLMLFKSLDTTHLSVETTKILTGLSAGSVFMGGFSYIGNMPNLIVKKMAQDNGVYMPSFFAYIAYACVLLLPMFWVYSRFFLC